MTVVAFDVFGTIATGHLLPGPYLRLAALIGCDAARFKSAALTFNLGPAELIAALAGQGLASAALIRRNGTAIRQVMEEIEADCARVRLYEDVLPVFERLRSSGIRYGLISNLAKPYAAPVLELLGDLQPEVCVWSFETGRRKPQPEIYQAFFALQRCSAAEVLMVGDRIANDVRAPRELGCKAQLLIRSDNPLKSDLEAKLGPDERISDLSGLLAVLKVHPGLEPYARGRVIGVNP